MAVHVPRPRAIENRLRTEPTVWFSSTRPDGRPHVVPVWFSWDGTVVDLFSKPHAQKVRNVAVHPDVMLAVGQPSEEWDVELVEGTAAVLGRPTSDVVTEAMFAKYERLMARAALDRTTFMTTYSQPVRITPTRFLGYGGKGWTDPSLVPDGDDVSGHLWRAPTRLTPGQEAALAEIRRVARTASPLDALALDD